MEGHLKLQLQFLQKNIFRLFCELLDESLRGGKVGVQVQIMEEKLNLYEEKLVLYEQIIQEQNSNINFLKFVIYDKIGLPYSYPENIMKAHFNFLHYS